MRFVKWATHAAAAATLALLPAAASAESTLKVVMHSDVKIIDPYWTTAYIVRNYGYMVYDTLLAVDDKLQVKPQMLEGWKISDDKLTYTFTLRDGLKFHDGQPVTAEDCVASLNRWAPKDAMGQKLMSFTKELKAVDDKTFTLTLKEPYGLVLETLGKPSSLVPFIMPKRIAETPGNKQISETIGSGPFVFRKDLWRPGERTIYDKFKDYKPRPEPASGLSGGKVVKVDRVEWINITDPQTAMNALINGEIDMIDQPVIELLPLLEGSKEIEVVDLNPLGAQLVFRFNTLHKPFDNPRIRQAAVHALNQKDFLVAGYTNPKFYKECKALFICGTPLATDKGFEDKLEGNAEKAKAILKEEKYDGAPVVLLYATDTNTGRLTPILKALLERAGFKVDMQAMDWNTVVSRRTRKEEPSAGGWSGFLTTWVSADVLDPVMSAFVGANCEKAAIGWPCDARIEELRNAFAKSTDPAKRKEIAEAVQVRVSEYPTHVQLGQFNIPSAIRTNVTGHLQAPAPVFWNVEKK
ncbi:ABC transporter substrate-binding protein [Reyranella sp.]|uniref:ABC transporter substrate-binding protein n=1 Tax=Reyranella sp. TaxID=1929291 RepID=UPI003BAB3498